MLEVGFLPVIPYNYILYRLSMMCIKRFVEAAVVKTIVDESIDVIQLIYSFAIAPPPTLPAASGSSSFMSVTCSVADPLNFDTAPFRGKKIDPDPAPDLT